MLVVRNKTLQRKLRNFYAACQVCLVCAAYCFRLITSLKIFFFYLKRNEIARVSE
jgi:hypothetical protein